MSEASQVASFMFMFGLPSQFSPHSSTVARKIPWMEEPGITSWQIDGETMKTGTDFIFLGFKISADCDCSHEIKRLLLLGRKAMTNLAAYSKAVDGENSFLPRGKWSILAWEI